MPFIKSSDIKEGRLLLLDPEAILVSPYQLREDYGDLEELLLNLMENGQQNPIRVWFSPSQDGYFSDGNGKYHAYCHDGNRRLRAVLLGKEKKLLPEDYKIKALVIPEIRDECVSLINQFTLNNTGKGFNAMELARLCKRLQELGLTQKEIAQRLGKSQPWVSNLLKLLTLDDQVKDLVNSGTSYSSILRQERKKKSKVNEVSEASASDECIDIHNPAEIRKLSLTRLLSLLLSNSHSLKPVGEKELSLVVPKALFNRLEDLVLGD